MKFSNGIAFIIIPSTEVTVEMVNHSTSTKLENMPLRSNMRLVEVCEPIHECFCNYVWYDGTEINRVWESL